MSSTRQTFGARRRAIARTVIAVAVAVAVLGTGIAYAIARPHVYLSTGSLVLAPLPEDESDLTNLLQGFDRSGTMGTFVELVASRDTLRRAGDPPVTITVRGIPDTRVIQVEARGDRDVARPALVAVMSAARASSSGVLSDLWELETLERASPAEPAPPSTLLILLATAVLAVLAATLTYVGLGRLFTTPASAYPEGATDHEARAPVGSLPRSRAAS